MPGFPFRQVFASLLQRPDAVMLEVGAGGELQVAKLRAMLSALLMLSPLINVASGGGLVESMIGLGATSVAVIFALVWLVLARNAMRYPWLSFTTGAYDVTLISLTLLMLALNHPPAGLNSMVAWCVYPLAILMTALRNDGRVTLFVGLLAVLEYAGLVWGVMRFANPEDLVSLDYGTVSLSTQLQRLLLLAMATIITAAVVYRMQRLVEMSGTDGLTGLPNRTWLLHRMPRLFERARNDGGTLSLALIDLDHFKRINDDIDHLAGDRALRHVVDVLKPRLGAGEWLIRLGGEEFVMLLRQPLGSSWERLDALRREVAQRPFVPDRHLPPWPLTFSAGLSVFPHEGQDLSTLLRRADLRLQRAKREGRNRVIARDH
ncbi:GGDEF domain-containing protein [Pseudoxanthomonas helianthi]|uniref:diguanylate cyclase n=1 Tax=Pseudoxanthomonas helianthi TaxID=1453541 RepID=A0A940X1X2_9GAMM|nr:GGDEF domain-containing protein [Pseudoxanthomonas helianthi]MBP3983095.1 GGDEF domain-containing protein [Pseudoxanthomonas helianthi]